MALNPGIRVELQRTPDDASQRHQLYVQWLNARVGNPSILQLDVVWTPEFAAAGWVLPLDKYGPPRAEFFPI
jgi:multiple sugar transport system substrate-binding protein